MRTDRRAFLASLGAAGALAACSGSKLVPNLAGSGENAMSAADNLFRPHASTLLPLQIVNKTGYPDSQIWFYTVGQKTPSATGPWFHITNATTGALAQCGKGDVVKGFADYSLNLASATKNGNMLLPTLNGGARMYFSVKDKLKIPLGPPNYVPGSPNGWDPKSAGGANYKVLFDWWEFVNVPADPTNGFNPNTTQVDMLGLPLLITAYGTDVPKGVSGGFNAGARTKIFNALAANKDFAKLVIAGTGGTALRAIAPNHGITSGILSKTYLDPYINQVWAYFAATGKNKLKAVCSQGTFYATVDAMGRLTFTAKGFETFWFVKPSTLAVFENGMLPYCASNSKLCPAPSKTQRYLAPNEVQGAIAPALNRSTLLVSNNELGVATASSGCKLSLAKKYAAPLTNYYAKYIHANAYGGLAYAFGNDDNCSDSSFVASRKPTKGVITLQPF